MSCSPNSLLFDRKIDVSGLSFLIRALQEMRGENVYMGNIAKYTDIVPLIFLIVGNSQDTLIKWKRSEDVKMPLDFLPLATWVLLYCKVSISLARIFFTDPQPSSLISVLCRS